MDRFWEKGLRFSCRKGCRYCCGVEPGFVFLTEEDVISLSRCLSLGRKAFVSRFCRETPLGLSLKEKAGFDCVFLTPEGCSVYEARPVQCRTYPFWDTIMKDRQSWEEEKAWCPGIGEGKEHSASEIEECIRLSERRHNPAKGSPDGGGARPAHPENGKPA